MTFTQLVKAHKAAEWLMANDAMIKSLAMQMAHSPAMAVVLAAYYGHEIHSRVNRLASNFNVTDEERELGYPVPSTEEGKRLKREEINRIKALSSNPISGS